MSRIRGHLLDEPVIALRPATIIEHSDGQSCEAEAPIDGDHLSCHPLGGPDRPDADPASPRRPDRRAVERYLLAFPLSSITAACSGESPIMPVSAPDSVGPAVTELTRTPCGASSSAQQRAGVRAPPAGGVEGQTRRGLLAEGARCLMIAPFTAARCGIAAPASRLGPTTFMAKSPRPAQQLHPPEIRGRKRRHGSPAHPRRPHVSTALATVR